MISTRAKIDNADGELQASALDDHLPPAHRLDRHARIAHAIRVRHTLWPN
jgi:hypothetical protein